ncbi:MAG TPA: hypothetical protein VJK25_03505 [Patescibacteria group bacterium]|nr:hypothetical protein [Patescibacteria group bacterium]
MNSLEKRVVELQSGPFWQGIGIIAQAQEKEKPLPVLKAACVNLESKLIRK